MADNIVLYDGQRMDVNELFRDANIEGCFSIDSDWNGRHNYNASVTDGENNLTGREREILSLICNELTNREIAETLDISIRTVDTHRRNLLLKTNAKNTAGMVKYAIKHQIIEV